MAKEKLKIKKEIAPKDKTGSIYLLSVLTKEAGLLTVLDRKIGELGTKVLAKEDLGEKKLFFPIKGEDKLRLISLFFSSEKENMAKIDQMLKHEEKSLRYLISKWKAPLPKENRFITKNKEDNV